MITKQSTNTVVLNTFYASLWKKKMVILSRKRIQFLKFSYNDLCEKIGSTNCILMALLSKFITI